MSSSIIETDKAIISLLEEKIVRVYIKDNVTLEEEDLNEFHSIYQNLLKHRKASFIIIFGEHSNANREAQTKFKSAKRAKIKLAEAFVINNLPHRILGNFHIKVNKPEHPTQIFSTEEEGLNWLRSMQKIT